MFSTTGFSYDTLSAGIASGATLSSRLILHGWHFATREELDDLIDAAVGSDLMIKPWEEFFLDNSIYDDMVTLVGHLGETFAEDGAHYVQGGFRPSLEYGGK